jgi:hypothetical protein
MVPGDVDPVECLAPEELRVPNNQIDELLQNGASFFKAEKPVDYDVVGMIEIASDRIRRRRKIEVGIGEAAGIQEVLPRVPLKGEKLGIVIMNQLAERDRQGAFDVAVYASLPKEKAVSPDIGFLGGHADVFEHLQDGMPCIIGFHVAGHALIIEEGE